MPWRVWVFAAALLALSPLSRNDMFFQFGQLVVLFLAVTNLVANYLVGDRETRRKIYWLLAAAAVLLLGRIAIIAGFFFVDWLHIPDLSLGTAGISVPIAGVLRLVIWAAAVTGAIVCILLAIFYTGAINPEMVIRRTAIYSAGFGFLLFTFGVFVNYVAAIVVEILVVEETLIEAIAGTLIAFKPLNDFLTRLADRFIPRQLSDEAAQAPAADVVAD